MNRTAHRQPRQCTDVLVHFRDGTYEDLMARARERGQTLEERLARAVALLNTLEDYQDQGARVTVVWPARRGGVRELVL